MAGETYSDLPPGAQVLATPPPGTGQQFSDLPPGAKVLASPPPEAPKPKATAPAPDTGFSDEQGLLSQLGTGAAKFAGRVAYQAGRPFAYAGGKIMDAAHALNPTSPPNYYANYPSSTPPELEAKTKVEKGVGLAGDLGVMALQPELGAETGAGAALARVGKQAVSGGVQSYLGGNNPATGAVWGGTGQGVAEGIGGLLGLNKPLADLMDRFQQSKIFPHAQAIGDAITQAKDAAMAGARKTAATLFEPLQDIPVDLSEMDLKKIPSQFMPPEMQKALQVNQLQQEVDSLNQQLVTHKGQGIQAIIQVLGEKSDQLASLKAEGAGDLTQIPLSVVQKMRDHIAMGMPSLESQTNVDVGALKQAYREITQPMQDAAKAAGMGKAWDAAQSFYRDTFSRLFYEGQQGEQGIGRLIETTNRARRTATQATGTVAPKGELSRLQDFNEMLTHIPPEQAPIAERAKQGIQQGLLDHYMSLLTPDQGTIAQNRTLGGAYLKAQSHGFEMMKEAFGPGADKLQDMLKLAQNRKLALDAEGQIVAAVGNVTGMLKGYGTYALSKAAYQDFASWVAQSPVASKLGSLVQGAASNLKLGAAFPQAVALWAKDRTGGPPPVPPAQPGTQP